MIILSRREGSKSTYTGSEYGNSKYERIEKYSESLNTAVDKIISEYCEDLDQIMDNLSYLLREPQKNITDDCLQNYILVLANTLYFTGSAQENVGIKEDLCKSIRQEAYANARLGLTGTVADRNAQAEILIQEETTVLSAYSRAYKKIKFKVDAGYEMLNSLKKIMNKRISELELSNSRYINHSKEDL